MFFLSFFLIFFLSFFLSFFLTTNERHAGNYFAFLWDLKSTVLFVFIYYIIHTVFNCFNSPSRFWPKQIWRVKTANDIFCISNWLNLVADYYFKKYRLFISLLTLLILITIKLISRELNFIRLQYPAVFIFFLSFFLSFFLFSKKLKMNG